MEERSSAVVVERRPLAGRTIVVTRPEEQAEALARPLQDAGARILLFPTIEIVAPSDPEPLRRAAREAASYDWLVFTSVNGVKAFRRALEEQGLDAGDVRGGAGGGGGPRVCAIGPATGGALDRMGLAPRVVPDEFVAEAVVEALDDETDLRGARVLLPRAAVARDALPDGLRERGARVDVVEAYRTVPAGEEADELRRRLDAGEVDLITFTASSTVRNFEDAVGADVGRARVAAIGPVTAGTARDLGYDVAVVAEEYTIPGLVEACVRHFTGGEGPPGKGSPGEGSRGEGPEGEGS